MCIYSTAIETYVCSASRKICAEVFAYIRHTQRGLTTYNFKVKERERRACMCYVYSNREFIDVNLLSIARLFY